MAEWQSGFVEANGIRLHYTRTGGNKPALIMAHGVTDSGLCWTPVARALEADYDVIMVDARGHGRSDAPETGYGPTEQAADLHGVITGLGLDRPAILGHSMGAVTTLVLAGTYPDVPGMILLEDPPPWWAPAPPLAPPDPEQPPTRPAPAWDPKRMTREELIAQQRAATPGWSDDELEPWADAKLQFSPNVLSIFDPAIPSSVEWFRVLRGITCPALLITGDPERGAIVSMASAAALQQMVPTLRVVHIPGAGHNIRRDQPARFLAAVRGFLAAPPTGPVISPEALPDGRVTFRLMAAYASDVRLSGDWLPFGAEPVMMAQGNDGVWSGTVGPLAPELYGYWYMLDGVRIADPRNPEVYSKPPAPLSLAYVPGPASDFMAVKPVPHGAVATLWYHSALLGTERRLHIYTPPDYDRSDQAYPVLYLLHGGGGDDSDWSIQGRAGFILDNLLAEGRITPMIVVMPDGNVGMTRPGADPFAHELLDTIVPLIEGRYRTISDRRSRALAGLSMGGLQTLNVGLWHPEAFSRLVVMSSGWFPPMLAEAGRATRLRDPRLAQLDLFWIGVGREDRLAHQNTGNTRALLERSGIPTTYYETGGGHTWQNWRAYLYEVAPLLFHAEPAPAEPSS